MYISSEHFWLLKFPKIWEAARKIFGIHFCLLTNLLLKFVCQLIAIRSGILFAQNVHVSYR